MISISTLKINVYENVETNDVFLLFQKKVKKIKKNLIPIQNLFLVKKILLGNFIYFIRPPTTFKNNSTTQNCFALFE